MDDKNLMEDVLLTVKGACDLYLHGTIESSTGKRAQHVRPAAERDAADAE